jgi:hypothetical protein
LWQRRVDPAYGPAVFDVQPARETLAEAEAALRAGDASRAEATYLRTLGKLGPFSDPAWKTDRATDERTRAQCHARLAALAYDQRDYERSLRQTAAAAAARHQAIGIDRCSDDDVRFMMTALVHAATVHERMGALDEALRSCRVALEFAAYADRNDGAGRDDRTRRSVASARRAAERLRDELSERGASTRTADAGDDLWPPTPRDLDLSPLYVSPPVEITAIDLDQLDRLAAEPASPSAPSVPETDTIELDLADIQPERADEAVIDLTEPEPVLDLRGDSLTADLDPGVDILDEVLPVDARFERDPDQHRARQAARRAERAAELEQHRDLDDHDGGPADPTELPHEGQLSEPAATLLAQARAQAATARELLAHGDDAAAIHAHRSVRTATRARPWAKHDEQVTVEVALTLVEALVTRSDVLSAAGNDEVAQTDLRRARTVADQLWRACPAPGTAAAAVLVCTRSAARGWHRDDDAEVAAHLEQASMVISDAETLGVGLPDELVTFEPPAGTVCERDALLAFGDQLFGALRTPELEPALPVG